MHVCVCTYIFIYICICAMQVVDVQFGLSGTAEPVNTCPTGTRACSTGTI